MVAKAPIDYADLLSKLNDSLEGAIARKEYHRLLSLDEAVRECSTEALKVCEEYPAEKENIARQLSSLIATYKKVSTACEERSKSLKQELQQANKGRKGAQSYLTVAGRSL